jgi:hypothetical protein
MNRRHLIGGGLAAGLTGLASPEAAAAAQDDGTVVAAAVRELSGTLSGFLGMAQPGPLDDVALVRQQQRTFIRANNKYPNYLDVGLNVWESVYFWHVKHRQPLELGRLADGRYTLRFMFTTLVMRPDVDLNYVSLGFDDEPLPPR